MVDQVLIRLLMRQVVMKDEFETTMRMMGCTDLSQLHPGLLNLYELGRSVVQELPKTARARSKL